MKQKLSEQEARGRIERFYELKSRKARADAEFDKEKKAFYAAMGGVIDDFGEGSSYRFSNASRNYRLTRSVPTKVIFDVDKLEEKLGKRLSSQVVETKAQIEDLKGLTKYLKGCSVDPKVFKSFISVQKTVDKAALEQLEALGEVDKEDLIGTFEVTVGNPSFRIFVKECEGAV